MPALLRLPRVLVAALVILSVLINWSLAMVRYQHGIAQNVERVLIEGLQLPWLTAVGKMSAQYLPWLKGPVSALPLFLLAGVLLWLIWRVRNPWRRLDATP